MLGTASKRVEGASDSVEIFIMEADPTCACRIASQAAFLLVI